MMLLFNLPMYKSIYPQAVHRVQIERSINNRSSCLLTQREVKDLARQNTDYFDILL